MFSLNFSRVQHTAIAWMAEEGFAKFGRLGPLSYFSWEERVLGLPQRGV